MNKKNLTMIACSGIFLLSLGIISFCSGVDIKMITLYIRNQKFYVEIAETPEQHMVGLMYRDHIPNDFAMLFVNTSEDDRSFWMKNCRVPLDIVFLDKNKRIINIHINVPPCPNEPCPSYTSLKPAQYILEFRGNRTKELKLKPGDTIFF